jgi:signal transduction histidine kinase
MSEFRYRLETDRFEVSIDVPADLPSVRADASALSLAIGNLLDNAIRYSEERRRVAVSARPAGRDIVLTVTDAGVGIPPDEVDRVTQKFFRGSAAVSGGSGLGLAITQRIVADHGGGLLIQSQVGVGTTVTLTLPIDGRGLNSTRRTPRTQR